MIFWAGLLFVLVGFVFRMNGVEWFEGEDSLSSVLIVFGGGLLVLWAVLTTLALIIVNKARKSMTSRHKSFFDSF